MCYLEDYSFIALISIHGSLTFSCNNVLPIYSIRVCYISGLDVAGNTADFQNFNCTMNGFLLSLSS